MYRSKLTYSTVAEGDAAQLHLDVRPNTMSLIPAPENRAVYRHYTEDADATQAQNIADMDAHTEAYWEDCPSTEEGY